MFGSGHGILSAESPGLVDKTQFTRVSILSHACFIFSSAPDLPHRQAGEENRSTGAGLLGYGELAGCLL
jgi:hypothetical protein